jgi:hypothetical protein
MSENAEKSLKTLDVPTAGRLYYNLCPRSSYQAAKRGEIPVIRIGRLLRVPVAAMEAMMRQGQKPAAEARK